MEKFNLKQKNEDISSEIKDIFKEYELIDENGENTPFAEMIENQEKAKPKPGLDYYDNKRDENFPYEGRFGINKE